MKVIEVRVPNAEMEKKMLSCERKLQTRGPVFSARIKNTYYFNCNMLIHPRSGYPPLREARHP